MDAVTADHITPVKKSIFADILNYIPQCRFEYWPNLGFSTRFKIILKSYGVLLIALFISSIFLQAIDNYVPALFHAPHLIHNDIAKLMQMVHGSAIKVYLMVCIGAPLLEETICRLPLSFKPAHIAISLSLATLFALGFKLQPVYLTSGAFLVPMLIAAAVYGILQTYLGNQNHYSPQRLSLNKKRGFIIFSILVFGFIHIGNYQPLNYHVWFLYPLYVIPQILMGWGLSYVRLRNGVLYSMLMHSLINTIPFLLYLSTHHI
jgi:hypothetical protein